MVTSVVSGTRESMFDTPYVDVDEWRDEPVRHRYVHGGFEQTETRFAFHFPPAERYEGRFFHYAHPWSGYEHTQLAGPMTLTGVDFAVASGAYLVESNGGRLTPTIGADDPTIHGYRAAAAAARYSRVMAAEMYGQHRPYGYCYGGSGGGWRSSSYIENGWDVWDGAVPLVVPARLSVPNQVSAFAHAWRLLRGKTAGIVDALDPGGSGDIYAGLNADEREALAAVIRLGFSPRSFFDFEAISRSYVGSMWACFADWYVEWDPGYFEDFWTVPGYLGADANGSIARARIRQTAKVTHTVMPEEAAKLGLPLTLTMRLEEQKEAPPVALQIDGLPTTPDLLGATLTVASGAAEGRTLYITDVVDGNIVLPGEALTHAHGLSGIAAGDEVLIDNSNHLAYQTLHRHQIYADPQDQAFCVAGQPIYPQRRQLLCERVERRARGANFTGRFPGKMIMVQCLMDEGAWPNNAIFYRRLVEGVWGPPVDEHYRLWFVDHAPHSWSRGLEVPDERRPAKATRVISYAGVIRQALRDVAAWVEQGVPPPASTEYDYVDGQVLVAPTAAARKGIQPVVSLTANGGVRAEVPAGEAVRFSAVAEVPANAGTIVAAEWDFEGRGDYPLVESNLDGTASRLTLTASHIFDEPGTYFPALRVSSQRDGDTATPYTRVPNLARVRVVVR